MPALKNTKHEVFCARIRAGACVTVAAHASGLDLMPAHDRGGFYVYILVDPRDGAVFYVGKGCKKRWQSHAREAKSGNGWNSKKLARISEIMVGGRKPEAYFVAVDLTEDGALDLERSMVQRIGYSVLTNVAPVQMSPKRKLWFCAVKWWINFLPFAMAVRDVLPPDKETDSFLRYYASLADTIRTHWPEDVRRDAIHLLINAIRRGDIPGPRLHASA